MPDRKKVAGVVDRIEGDIVVVVFEDPDNGKKREIDVNKNKLKGDNLKKGDTVLMDLLVEIKLPAGDSMLEFEDAIEKALEQVKNEVFQIGEPRKKTSTKRARKA